VRALHNLPSICRKTPFYWGKAAKTGQKRRDITAAGGPGGRCGRAATAGAGALAIPAAFVVSPRAAAVKWYHRGDSPR